MTALKMLGADRVGGYLVVWGSPSQRDLQGEYFSPQSELGLDWYPQRPMLYHHGLDATMKSSVVGVIDTVKADQTGVWAEGQLNMRNQYVQAVLKLIEKGILGWSSGSLPHLVEVASDGFIKRWPIIEGSLTPTPAEPRRTDVHTIKSAYAAMGLDSTRLDGESAPAENVSVENAPTLKELCAKAEIEITINTDDETADELEGSDGGVSEPIENTTPGGVTVNPRDIILATITAMCQANNIQMDATAQGALADQVLVSMNQPATAAVPPDFAAQAAPVIGKALGEYVIAEQNKQIAFQSSIVTAQKAAQGALTTALAGQGGVSRVGGFQPTPEQEKPAVKANITGVSDRRFDHLSASDMALAYQVLTEKNVEVSESFALAMSYKTAQLVEKGDKAATTLAVKSAFPFTKASDIFQADHSHIRSGMKANEAMGVTQSGFGSNYANTYYSANVWEVVRQETNVYADMIAMGMDEKEVPQGFVSDTVPLEGADMTWYVAGPAADEVSSTAILNPVASSSKFATSNKEVTLARLSARTYWTRELQEDSIVDIVAEANRKIQVSGKEQIEYILLNGDTVATASTNLNAIDATPGTGGSRPSYMLLNGLLKQAIITNTGCTYAAGSTLGDGTFLNLLPLMDTDNVSGKFAADPDKIMYVVDNRTYFAMLSILSLKTQDVFKAATLEQGMVSKIWGVKVNRSAQMAIANTSGKIAVTTAANNVAGRILGVRPDQWAARWKSKIEVFTEFDPKTYATTLVAHMRWGLTFRAAGASVAAVNVAIAIPT